MPCCVHALLTSSPCLAGRRAPLAGNRAYASSVVRLLDPSGQLFGDRIIAQVGPGQGSCAVVALGRDRGL